MPKKPRIEIFPSQDELALIDKAAELAALPRATWVKQQTILSAWQAIRAAGVTVEAKHD
jgi:uncharacterized protein (DUF1778 family)